MKYTWIVLLVLISCRASNDIGGHSSRTADYRIEISFVNSDANYNAIVNAIVEIGALSELRYPIGSLYQPVNIMSVSCYQVSGHSLSQFKSKIGSCHGILSIYDPSMR